MALYYCICRRSDIPSNIMGAKAAMIGAFVISLLELGARYTEMFGLGWDGIADLYEQLPLSGYSLAWVPVSILAFVLAKGIYRYKRPALLWYHIDK